MFTKYFNVLFYYMNKNSNLNSFVILRPPLLNVIVITSSLYSLSCERSTCFPIIKKRTNYKIKNFIFDYIHGTASIT